MDSSFTVKAASESISCKLALLITRHHLVLYCVQHITLPAEYAIIVAS